MQIPDYFIWKVIEELKKKKEIIYKDHPEIINHNWTGKLAYFLNVHQITML